MLLADIRRHYLYHGQEPDGDVRFFIGSQEYLYHEYIDDVCKDILDRSPDIVFFHKSHVFYKVDHWNDPMYLVVPIKYIEVSIPENILKGEEKWQDLMV